MDSHYDKRPPSQNPHRVGADAGHSIARNEVPELGDIFSSFKKPDKPREFKTEPMDDNVWQDLQAKEAAASEEGRKRKRKDRDSPQPRSRAGATQQHGKNKIMIKQFPASTVVDLTEDWENGIPKSPFKQNVQTQTPVSTATRNRVKPLNIIQLQYMDKMQIPSEILNQAKAIYESESIPFPQTLRLWAHLKHFVTNQSSARLNLQLVMMMQAHVFYNSSQPNLAHQDNGKMGIVTQQHQNQLSPAHTAARAPDLDTFDGMRGIKVEAEVVEREQQEPFRASDPAVSISRTPITSITYDPAATAQRLTAHQHQSHASRPQENASQAVQKPIDPPVSQVLVKPIGLMSDILPVEAPRNHPHLSKIWDEKLLALPASVHQHMNLLDAAVSIIARYDLQARSAVEGFLDSEHVHHFFFVFKARDKLLHSWSIERENNIVTIGIERKSRAIRKLNEAEIEACSSGRIDLSIQYEIRHPPQSVNSILSNDTESAPPPAPSPKSFPTYTLTNSTLLPSAPDLTTFLYSTPPTRGADEHAHISHPLQSNLLDPSNAQSPFRDALSIFARYMQHTIFTARAIDAEIQAVWGRKLRFDPVLGRVRPVWDYALKGAKTQKAKRERGEYNRYTNGRKKNPKREIDDTERAETGDDEGKKDTKERSEKEKGVSHPGKGESKEYLKNGVLSRPTRHSSGQANVENFLDADDEHLEVEDTIEARRSPTVREVASKIAVREPMRKKLKREAASGSEHSDSETYSN